MFKTVARLMLIAALCLHVFPGGAAAQPAVELVPGSEFVAGANLTAKNVKAEGTIFVPDGVPRVRAVIVLVESWPGAERGAVDLATGAPRADRPFVDLAVGRFRDQGWRRLSQTCECALLHVRLGTVRPDADRAGVVVDGALVRSGVSTRVVRDAAAGGADALLVVLQRLGEDSSHRELKDAPLLLWGWSAPAGFATTFAELYPERTLAFIRYHTHLRGASPNLTILRNIPALLIAGGNDQQAGTEDAEMLWKRGRSAGAPWTFAVEPGATHAGEESLISSHGLIFPWISAIARQRLEPGGKRLRPVTQESGWLGDNRNGEVAPHAVFSGPKAEASWLPDEPTARGWQTVLRAAK